MPVSYDWCCGRAEVLVDRCRWLLLRRFSFWAMQAKCLQPCRAVTRRPLFVSEVCSCLVVTLSSIGHCCAGEPIGVKLVFGIANVNQLKNGFNCAHA